MRRSPWLSLIVCALVAAGCQRADPAQPASASGSSGGDIIEATPLTPDAPTSAPAPQTPAPEKPEPQPAPAQPPTEATSAPDAEASRPSIPEAWDMKPGDVQNCRDAIGSAAAARLVERCIRVSPATRPPCNAANPCALIQGEIERSCKLWQGDGNPPAECRS
ncbi:hypothetical protein [Brevundimonas sp.]|uniref:hypothetical protein n=1 Tax=Brevundimonas sp. TaxID=1871086 RepID=UPI0028A26393|nr:hypothetical protein [Brevundimonas sp.]